MSLCDQHVMKLAKALVDAGLGELFTKSAEDCKERAEQEATEPTLQSFDPVNGCQDLLYRNLEELCQRDRAFDPDAGRLVKDAQGDSPCPVCYANKRAGELDAQNPPDAFEEWIGWATEDAVEEAKRRGFVGATQEN